MGFFKACIEVILQLTPFYQVVEFDGPGSQQPLHLPSDEVHHVSPGHVTTKTASPVFKSNITCQYPNLESQGWTQCNSNSTRDCWLLNANSPQPWFTQYDIQTDYEDKDVFAALSGVTREYWLDVVANETFSPYGPGGTPKKQGKFFNNQYPGPVIEACWGDQIVVHVTNHLADPLNGTTIHWHGIRQFGTNDMDGVNGVTQCPIAPGDTFTYNFTATQYGHTWYHSHYSLQYPDGVAGPLIIHGPTSSDWDEDLGPIFITDWVDDTAFIVYEQEMNAQVPAASAIVVNGIGTGPNSTEPNFFETTVTKGKKYLLRLINGSAGTSYIFSIDNHNFTVVATDLVPVLPYTTNSIMVAIGQRYTIVLEADQDVGDYWLRTTPAAGCNNFTTTVTSNTSIIHYETGPNATPGNNSVAHVIDLTCQDEPSENLHPVVPWAVNRVPINNATEDTYEIGIQANPDLSLYPEHPYRHWVLDNNPMWLNFSDPTLLNLDKHTWDANLTVKDEDFDRGFVYLIIDGRKAGVNSTFGPAVAAHPIHLHGSDFVILRQSLGNGSELYDPLESPKLFNFDNPTRRDVALVPAGGYLAIAFKPDNPGSWLIHCHIAWHASSGLALQLLVQQENIAETIGTQRLADVQQTCDQWRSYPNTTQLEGPFQVDSGI